MSKNINLVKSDIGNLFEELESVAKEAKLEEKKRKDYVETTETDLSSLFSELEKVSQETKKLNEEDKDKLNEFANIFSKLNEEYPEDLPSDVEPKPEPEPEKPKDYEEPPEDDPTDDVSGKDSLQGWIEKKTDAKPRGIVEDVVNNLDEMRYQTEVKEELDEIEKLKQEFQSLKRKLARDLSSSSGGGAGSFAELDDVDADTAKVDGKVIKFDGTTNKFIGSDFSVAGTGLTGTTLASGITASSLTSVGTLTSLTVDNISINGTTIGHTDDTDLITLADGLVTVAGELSVTTLDIGGTNVTSTAAELNLVDGITAGTVSASKAVIADSNKDISGFRNLSITGDLTVSGTTTTVNQVEVNVTNAFVFEGETSDANETTLRVNDPSADRKVSIQDKTGTIALISGFKLDGTDSSKTNEGDFLVLDTSDDENDRLLFEDGTSDPIAVLASHGITLSGQGWNAFQFENP